MACTPKALAVVLSLALFCAVPGQARAAARGEDAGCGSPPCSKTYDGSGDVPAMSKLGAHVLPTPNPAGQLLPGCVCTMPNIPQPVEQPVAPTPCPEVNLPSGEVEVLTVDVRLANKVRCDNASIAEDVARMLKIPVQRVTVTPWSWTLGVPQQNYLGFVQEDHDRCDCQGQSGKGFRKVVAKAAADGWMLGKDTSVMTVSEYKALQDSSKRTAIVQPSAAAAGPPPARIQMLTRDPCLVQLLRSETPHFREKIAELLGVPEDKVIIDPPAVKGTVGLMQFDTFVNTEERMRQVPVLAVRHCSATEAGPSTYNVAAPNVTQELDGTAGPEQVVALAMKLSNIDYDLLSANVAILSALTASAKEAIGVSGHVPASAVRVALYPDSGSVILDAKIVAPSGTAPAAIEAFLNGTVHEKLTEHLKGMPALRSVVHGIIDCTIVSIGLEDQSLQEEESNRAWIAAWNLVLLPPFAEDAAWRLLDMIHSPSTLLSKLLPMTLARVPGLKYRALQAPNVMNETRLPPPEDKGVGFSLPNPLAKKASEERMKREAVLSNVAANDKAAADLMTARKALQDAQQTAAMIKQAGANFAAAARAHAMHITAPSAVRAPEIVPSHVLTHPGLDSESPYPWRQQSRGKALLLHRASSKSGQSH